jgi:hypothetical protein
MVNFIRTAFVGTLTGIALRVELGDTLHGWSLAEW